MQIEAPRPKTVLIAPGLLAGPDGETVLRQSLPSLERMAELGTLRKLSPIPEMQTPEALYLGMRRTEAQMAQGPLTVAGLGADPPDRSTHFHVSVLTRDGEGLSIPNVLPSAEEERQIVAAMKRLDTKTLTTVTGEALDHGLVWEGLGDLMTRSPASASAKPARSVLPEGDAEPILRRFIDDSVNVLSELEMNQRRVDEGLPAFDILWPWGHGVRLPVPNLALRRGEPAQVESDSLRLAGLSRLAGYRHGDRHWHRSGLNLDLGGLAERAQAERTLIIVTNAAAELRAKGLLEELEWFVRRFDDLLLAPLFEAALRSPRTITLLAPSQTTPGLTVSFSHGQANSNAIPFDERALEERGVSTVETEQAIDEALRDF